AKWTAAFPLPNASNCTGFQKTVTTSSLEQCQCARIRTWASWRESQVCYRYATLTPCPFSAALYISSLTNQRTACKHFDQSLIFSIFRYFCHRKSTIL